MNTSEKMLSLLESPELQALRRTAGTLETKSQVEADTIVSAEEHQQDTALIFSKFSQNKDQNNKRFYIHVQGDSNSQGLLPGALSEYSMDIGAGFNVAESWPKVMEKELRRQGVRVSVENHSECGRRLSGKTYIEGERGSIGEKDGRVALQGIINSVFNKHTEKCDKVAIMIDLGGNDLQEPNITTEYLTESLIMHVLTILTNPDLQFSLWTKCNVGEKPLVLAFMQQLKKYISEDIRRNEGKPVSTDTSSSKIVSHGEQVKEILNERNRPIIQKLFNMIAWKIILIPSVKIIGFPFGKDVFASAELSQHWKKMVQETVAFFGVSNIFAIEDAQQYVIPHHDEFGGSAHYDSTDHQVFGREIAQFLLMSKQMKLRPTLLDNITSLNASTANVLPLIEGLKIW